MMENVSTIAIGQAQEELTVQGLFYKWLHAESDCGTTHDDDARDAASHRQISVEKQFASIPSKASFEIDMKIQVLANMFEQGGVDDIIWMLLVASIRADLRSLTA